MIQSKSDKQTGTRTEYGRVYCSTGITVELLYVQVRVRVNYLYTRTKYLLLTYPVREFGGKNRISRKAFVNFCLFNVITKS